MYPTHGSLRWVVKLRVVVTAFLQLLHTLCCARAQIIQSAKYDRFGWTNLCAGRNESALLSIITKCALESAACVRQRRRSTIDHAERARHHAIAAAIADIVLHENRADFCPHD